MIVASLQLLLGVVVVLWVRAQRQVNRNVRDHLLGIVEVTTRTDAKLNAAVEDIGALEDDLGELEGKVTVLSKPKKKGAK